MNYKEYTKRLNALHTQLSEYYEHKAPLGREVQQSVTDRIHEITEQLKPESDFILEVATKEQPFSELVALVNERETLHKINGLYNFRYIAESGTRPIQEAIKELKAEYIDYFKQHLDAENAEELIPQKDRELKAALEPMLAKHRAEKAREAELKQLTEPFMKDLDELLKRPHINRVDRDIMLKRASKISPECIQAANKLHGLPLLA